MTGEQPAKAETPLSESTPIKLGLALVLATALCTAAVAVYQVGELKLEGRTQALEIKSLEKDIAKLDTRVSLSESGFISLKGQLDKMNEKLDRLLESRTERSVYRQPPRGPGH